MPEQSDKFVRPLFSRFIPGRDGRFPRVHATPEEYLALVARDVESLLASRSATDMETFREAGDATVAGYGLPDFSHLSPASPDDMWLLAETVADALRRFEPRLENARVAFVHADGVDRGRFSITANLAGVPDRFKLDVAMSALAGR